jgi:all-trans-retinol 13,14-reductase
MKEKVALTDSVIEYTYALPDPVEVHPGQCAKIHCGKNDFGAYSIAGLHDRHIRFLIDTKSGGQCANYFTATKPGDFTAIRLSINRKVFFATGMGIIPFLSMFQVLAQSDLEEEVDLFFGCRYARDNFIDRYLQECGGNLRINAHICISREKVEGHSNGRVTDMLNRFDRDLDTYDFYVSGSPAMVQEVTGGLRAKGASNVYSEKY